jgi:hypothetical protein
LGANVVQFVIVTKLSCGKIDVLGHLFSQIPVFCAKNKNCNFKKFPKNDIQSR